MHRFDLKVTSQFDMETHHKKFAAQRIGNKCKQLTSEIIKVNEPTKKYTHR